MFGNRELIQAELPPYEAPPPWIPFEQVIKKLTRVSVTKARKFGLQKGMYLTETASKVRDLVKFSG